MSATTELVDSNDYDWLIFTLVSTHACTVSDN